MSALSFHPSFSFTIILKILPKEANLKKEAMFLTNWKFKNLSLTHDTWNEEGCWHLCNAFDLCNNRLTSQIFLAKYITCAFFWHGTLMMLPSADNLFWEHKVTVSIDILQFLKLHSWNLQSISQTLCAHFSKTLMFPSWSLEKGILMHFSQMEKDCSFSHDLGNSEKKHSYLSINISTLSSSNAHKQFI